jgi:hypothetical protein
VGLATPTPQPPCPFPLGGRGARLNSGCPRLFYTPFISRASHPSVRGHNHVVANGATLANQTVFVPHVISVWRRACFDGGGRMTAPVGACEAKQADRGGALGAHLFRLSAVWPRALACRHAPRHPLAPLTTTTTTTDPEQETGQALGMCCADRGAQPPDLHTAVTPANGGD